VTDDIVARLRLYANASIDGGWANVFRSDLNIAADEIERLRKELKLISHENLQHRNNVLDDLARMDEELGLR
jgi:hypothetical protein